MVSIRCWAFSFFKSGKSGIRAGARASRMRTQPAGRMSLFGGLKDTLPLTMPEACTKVGKKRQAQNKAPMKIFFIIIKSLARFYETRGSPLRCTRYPLTEENFKLI